MATIIWIAVGFVLLLLLLWLFPVTLWFQALISGARVSLLQLILMRWRKVPPGTIVQAMIAGTKAGLKLNANELEAHYLAKGHVLKVVNALISADKANIALDFKKAAAIDLAGRDVFEAVQMSVNPQGDNHSSRIRSGQGRYPADCHRPCHSAHQYPPAGGRCR